MTMFVHAKRAHDQQISYLVSTQHWFSPNSWALRSAAEEMRAHLKLPYTMRRMEMRKVDTWLESTREYALRRGERKFFFFFATTKGWVPHMSYIRHKDSHPVRPFLVQTLHLNVLTIHTISYWPKCVGETWIKAQPGRVVTELCMRKISCYGIPILPELRIASWDLRLPFVNNKLLEKEVRLYTVC